MLTRLVVQARQQPARWWIGYALFAAVFLCGALLWRPDLLPVGIAIVVSNLIVALATPAVMVGRHRRKHSGTKHLAE